MAANDKGIPKDLWQMLRSLFRGKPVEVGAPLACTVGLAMIYGDDFVTGIIVLAVAGLWGIAGWLLSEKLQRLKPQKPTKQKYAKVEKYKRARRRYLLWSFSAPLGIVATLALSALFFNNKREDKNLKEYAGFLLPGNEPDPPSFCSAAAGPDDLKVFVGRNEAFSDRFPYVVLRVRKQNRIVIERSEGGRIALNMDIFDEYGRVIVTFEHGTFTVIQGNILDMKRSKSTLVVRDQYKHEVLNVRYLNKQSLQISGLLRYPGVGLLVLPSAVVNGMCSGHSDAAFNVN